MRGRAAIAVMMLVMVTNASCKKESTPPNSGEVVGVSGANAVPVATTTATSQPTTPGVNADSTGAQPTGDPFAQARNKQAAGAAGSMLDPFAAARLAPVSQLPKTLPPGPHGATVPLKIAPIVLTFTQLPNLNSTAELKSSGAILLDSKRMGAVGGNKVTLLAGKHKTVLALRPDAYAVFTDGALKNSYVHRDADGLTTNGGDRLSVSPDGLAIVSVGTSGERLIARMSAPINEERVKTTALMLAEAELAHAILRGAAAK